MRILIADDYFMARRILKEILAPYGDCDVVIDGDEAVQAFRLAWEEGAPYDLLCLDIMMPGMDGQEALVKIREMEAAMGVPPAQEAKVLMISALDDPRNVVKAYAKGGAASYLVKPIEKETLLAEVRKLGLIA